MWVTNNYLPWGLWLMESLGFVYKTNVAWRKRRLATEDELKALVKLFHKDREAALRRLHELQDVGQIGLGQYFRGGHELLLFGVRGRGPVVRTDRKDLKSMLHAERGKHSRKPEETYGIVEARSIGPYLELFARSGREGWHSWGNEYQEAA
jgi:N6-adenosine-specific RNA methylase IME4